MQRFFRVFFNEPMLRHVQKCTIAEAIHQDESSWKGKSLQKDKFALATDLWDPFIENCKKSYVPGENLTVDGQLFLTKRRCLFTQYICSKPDKFGVKFLYQLLSPTNTFVMAFPIWAKITHGRLSNHSQILRSINWLILLKRMGTT